MRLKFLGSGFAKWPQAPFWLFKPVLGPIELILTASVRRLAVKRPEIFRKIGRFGTSIYVIAPSDLPFVFRLTPLDADGAVKIVSKNDESPFSVRVSGRLATLVGLFDGSVDADSSFFGRDIRMEGATDAALALHNALEAAELRASDILGLPPELKGLFDKVVSHLSHGARDEVV